MSTTREQIIEVAKAHPHYPSCWRFRAIEGCPDCCISCHGDAEDFGYSLSAAIIPTDSGEVEVDVCCTVTTWIDANLKP